MKVDVFNDLDQFTKTFTVKNLPFIFQMFDTFQEINPLDQNGKHEYIKEKGMEVEMNFEKVIGNSGVFDYYRIPHSGRHINAPMDFLLWPTNDPSTCLFVDVCSYYKHSKGSYRIHKNGVQIKRLLTEINHKNLFYADLPKWVNDKLKTTTNKRVLIPFYPYHNEWWCLPVNKDHYYIGYKSDLSIGYDMKHLIRPLEDILVEYNGSDKVIGTKGDI